MPNPGRPRGFDRAAAVDRAVLLFWEHGYEATSLALLREGMGDLSAASFYAAFGSKEALFREVVSRYSESLGAGARPGSGASLPPRAALEQLLRSTVRTVAGDDHPRGDLVVLAGLVGSSENGEIRTMLAGERSRVRAGVLACVARAVADGDLPASLDATVLAALFETLLFGLSIQARDRVGDAILDQVVTQALGVWDALSRPR